MCVCVSYVIYVSVYVNTYMCVYMYYVYVNDSYIFSSKPCNPSKGNGRNEIYP